MDTAQREKRQQELPDLAARLGFANVVITDLNKQLSQLRVQGGKDAAYIIELEAANRKMKRELADPLAGQKLKKLAEEELVKTWKLRFDRMAILLKKMRHMRDRTFSDLLMARSELEKRTKHSSPNSV